MAVRNSSVNKINIRQATLYDIEEIMNLYSETVRNVNRKDYTPEQIRVWSEGSGNNARLEKAIDEQYFIVAEIRGTLAGFSSIAKDGYLDFMYVHKDHQREGMALALLIEIEKKAIEQKNSEIYSHVSKTAKGFFEKFGYEHKKDLQDIYKGVLFINALMVKKLNYSN